MHAKPFFLTSLTALAVGLGACGPDGAPNARRAIRERHVPRILGVLRDDFAAHRAGLEEAAGRIAPGFAVEDPALRERQMRAALIRLRQPPRGIARFMASPMSFLAAVAADGKVVARDLSPDRMAGQDYGERFPSVRTALREGRFTYALVEFPPPEGQGVSDWVRLLATPSRNPSGEIVGGAILGVPLWRIAQQLSRQLRVDHGAEVTEQGLVLWVYLAKGAQIFRHGTPPEMDEIVPDEAARRAGLARSPKGFTGELLLHTKWYGYGVVPVPSIGPDVQIIVFRSEP